jgi:hypothetical protein
MSATSGTTMIGNEIAGARALTMKAGLRLEIVGLRVSRGVSMYAMVQKEFGFRGNKQRVFDQLSQWCDSNLLGR